MSKYSSTFKLGLLLMLPIILMSCRKEVPKPQVPSDYIITIQNEFVTQPAKVSVFFKVETEKGDPVPGLVENNFIIYEKGRNDEARKEISEFEAERRISDNDQIFAYSTILLLDLSGSVTSSSLAELKEASKSFVDAIMPPGASESYYMGIWWFDGEDVLHPLVPFTTDATVLKAGIDGVTTNISSDNSTDLYGAVIKGTQIATDELSTNKQKGILAASSVVVFTDGTDQAGRYAKSAALNSIDATNADMSYFSIGLGSEIDEEVLRDIGINGFAYADDNTKLVEKFQEIAGLVSAEANSYYLFEYCSPKRDGSGTNELTIRAFKGQQAGEETTTFNATGFSGGCSL